MMCNTQIFKEVAYKARSKDDILNAVGEFLNNVTGALVITSTCKFTVLSSVDQGQNKL